MKFVKVSRLFSTFLAARSISQGGFAAGSNRFKVVAGRRTDVPPGRILRLLLGSFYFEHRNKTDFDRDRCRSLGRRIGLSKRRSDERRSARSDCAVGAGRRKRCSGENFVSFKRSKSILAF